MKNIRKTIAFLICAFSLCFVVSVSSIAATVPSKPAKLVASAVKADAVKLAWSSSSGANFYRVFVKSEGKWKALKDTTATSYVVSGLSAGKSYTFAVKSGLKQSGKLYFSSDYAYLTVKTKGLVATKVIASAGESSVKLMWAKVPGAKGYSVYRKVSGEWKIISNLAADKNTYTVKDLKSDTSYQFAVRSFVISGGKRVYSPASNILKIKTEPSTKIVLSCAGVNESSVKLKWTKVNAATGYRIFRYVNGGWSVQDTVNSGKILSYTVKGLSSDKKYQFRVRAFTRVGSAVKWYTVSDTCTVITDPSVSNLTLYRTEKLKSTFNSSEYTFSYNSYNNKLIKSPVTIAKKGSSYYLTAKVDGESYSLLNNSSGNFVIFNSQKLYAKVPKALAATVSIKSAVAELLPDSNYFGDVYIDTFEGKKVVCESYSNMLGTKSINYYYKAGSLIGIEELDYNGKVVEKAVVTVLKKSAKESLFTIPSGYSKVAYVAK